MPAVVPVDSIPAARVIAAAGLPTSVERAGVPADEEPVTAAEGHVDVALDHVELRHRRPTACRARQAGVGVDPDIRATEGWRVVVPVEATPAAFTVDDPIRVLADADPRIFRVASTAVLQRIGGWGERLARLLDRRVPLAVNLPAGALLQLCPVHHDKHRQVTAAQQDLRVPEAGEGH